MSMVPEPKPVEKSGESLEEAAAKYADIFGERSDPHYAGFIAGGRWGLKQGEAELASAEKELQDFVTYAEPTWQQIVANRDIHIRDIEALLKATQAKCEALEARVGRYEKALKEIAAAGQKTRLLGMDVNPKHGLIHCPSIAREALAETEAAPIEAEKEKEDE